MVGLVIVSHSVRLADGVVELAAQMAGPEVRLATAAGLDGPGDALGTDAARVLRAVEEVWSDDGVLVLMDLGSAVLSAELAVDLLDEERRGKVRLTAAPLVEGAVAAAVSASLGDRLEAVAAAAEGGLTGKAGQLEPTGGEAVSDAVTDTAPAGAPMGETLTAAVVARNRLGLHARPAATLVRTLAAYDAEVTLRVPDRGRGPADARSLTAVGALGVRRGDRLEARAEGPDAAQALDALRRLAQEGFGEPGEPSVQEAATAGARAGGPAPAPPTDVPATAPAAGAVLAGIPASPGVAVGAAWLLRRGLATTPAAAPSDPETEWKALQAALAATAADVRRSRDAVAERAGPTEAAIFDAHLLLLEDPALVDATRAAVAAGRLPAARAWAAAVDRAAAAWDALEDPYQRARAADVRDVGAQVLRRLGEARGAAGEDDRTAERGGAGRPPAPGEPVVAVADELTPADVAAFDRATVTGIACARGGPTSHAVILARALGLPVVVGVGAAVLAVPDQSRLLVDGDAGSVTVRPSRRATDTARRRRRAQELEAAAAARLAADPAVTGDGTLVAVEANVATPKEAAAAVAAGADGIGLLRTEFLFLGAAAMPGEDDQAAAYDAVAAALDGRPLTIRTLDAGADKPLPYLPLPPERNPFLGVRGLRLGLLYPDQLRTQLRAVLRVAARRPVRVMFPMVADADEVRRALALLGAARDGLLADGGPAPERLEVGIMLEVPSAALLAEQLAPLVDFFSVGTNDLTQYALAAERGNAGVAALGDPLHPAVLRLIGRAADAALAAGRTVAVCGELAGDAAAVPLLLGLGVRELSMGAARIAAAKQAVRGADLAAARRLATAALAADSPAAVRRLLADAAAHG